MRGAHAGAVCLEETEGAMIRTVLDCTSILMVLLDCPTQAFIMMERSRYERGTDSAHHESAKCLNVEAGRHVELLYQRNLANV